MSALMLLVWLVLPGRALPPEGAFDTGAPTAAQEVGSWLYGMYGAVLRTRATPPPVIRFEDEAAVSAFQAGLETGTVVLSGRSLTLQAPAADALAAARDQLRTMGIDLQARGSGPAGRSYAVSVANWRSRLHPALRYWAGRGALDREQASAIRALADREQIAAVLELESRGLWCSTRRDRSILSSVAAPGSSQHHSLLAVDLITGDRRLPHVLAAHGWHRTVRADPPHFTYLGVPATDLPGLGLVPVLDGGAVYWVPGDVR